MNAVSSSIAGRVRADDLERQIPGLVMFAFDGTYVPEVIEIPAEDHTAELEKLDTAIADWEARAIAGDTAESVVRILDGLHAKRRVLIDAGVRTEARREIRETGELVTDRWLSLETDHERGTLLRSMRIRIMARKASPARRVSGYSKVTSTGQTLPESGRTPTSSSSSPSQTA